MSLSKESEFRLKSCIKHYTLDQDKTVDPLETVKKAIARLEKRYDLSNLKIERRADAVEGAYSFSSLSDQMNASGKGLTPEQSQASAIMEFVERYSWLHYNYGKAEGYVIRTFEEIKRGDIPTVEENYFLNTFVDLDRQRRKDLLDVIKKIPFKWVLGTSLTDYEHFYYPLNWHNYVFSSNGLATGNAMEEAILQALCEVIERENIFRFLQDKKVPNDIDQGSIENPLLRRVLDNAARSNISFEIKDISFDFKVPTFVVRGTSESQKGTFIYQGCGHGTHPHPEKALIRAFSEYFEGYSLLKSRLSEFDIDWKRVMPKMQKMHYGFVVLYNPEMFKKRKRVIKLGKVKDFSQNDIKDEIESIVKVLRRQGHRVIFIDKSHPELKIPVPRVFVPTFRSLMGADVRMPQFMMSEAAYEAGMRALADSLFQEARLRSSYYLPQSAAKVNLDKIFKKDYKENFLAFGGIKKDAAEMLKEVEKTLKLYA